jgi:hypothetical protein
VQFWLGKPKERDHVEHMGLGGGTNIKWKLKGINLILMDPCIVDYSVEIPTRCSFVIEFIFPKFFKGSTCFERHTAHHQEL